MQTSSSPRPVVRVDQREDKMRVTHVPLLAAAMMAAGAGGLLASPVLAQPADHKITICHVPPGNPGNAHSITIDQQTWENGHTPHSSHNSDFVVDAADLCSPSD